MDTVIDPALVNNKMPEAPSVTAEEWKYAQDADWPSQLASSNGQGESFVSSPKDFRQ